MTYTFDEEARSKLTLSLIHYVLMESLKGSMFDRDMEQIKHKGLQRLEDMTPRERCAYEEELRKERERKFDLTNKFSSQGKSLAEIERERQEALEKHAAMMEEIEDTVRSLGRGTALSTYLFYVMHVNIYCRVEDSGNYIPCEIALVEFNILDGIRKKYHTLINARAIPLGYTFQATKYSEETHCIPLPTPEFQGENDHPVILKNIQLFLMGQNGDTAHMPPVYTKPEHIDVVQNVLWRLEKNLKQNLHPDDSMFRVYPIPYLFTELLMASSNTKVDIGGVERELERDVMNFAKGISCDFHEGTDAIQYCSLSFVHRWIFVVLKHCCKHLSIDMIPGKHCPRVSDEGNKSPSTSSSWWSPKKEKPAPEIEKRRENEVSFKQPPRTERVEHSVKSSLQNTPQRKEEMAKETKKLNWNYHDMPKPELKEKQIIQPKSRPNSLLGAMEEERHSVPDAAWETAYSSASDSATCTVLSGRSRSLMNSEELKPPTLRRPNLCNAPKKDPEQKKTLRRPKINQEFTKHVFKPDPLKPLRRPYSMSEALALVMTKKT